MPHGQITKCTDKLPGLINKAEAKIGKRGRFAGGRAGLLKSAEKLELLRKVDSRKVRVRGTGKGPHLGKEQLTGQPFTHVSSCDHQPVGEPDPEGSKEPHDLKNHEKTYKF